MALKSARIVDFCGKSSGLADFENTVDRGSAVISVDADSGLCRSSVGFWVLNEIWIIDLSSALVGMLTSSSKLFLFSKEVQLNSRVRLFCTVLLGEINSAIHMYQVTFET